MPKVCSINPSTPARAVAGVCVAAELVRVARAGGSRRVLGQQTGIPPSVISNIEDASVLPSDHQLIELSKHLKGIRPNLFEEAKPWGGVPWVPAICEILFNRQGQDADEISRSLAGTIKGCDPSVVKWRLTRQLSRLESSPDLVQKPNGTWEALPHPEVVPPAQINSICGKCYILAVCDDPEQDAIFHLESEPGHQRIILNRCHPHYASLHGLLSYDATKPQTSEALHEQLVEAGNLVRELLVAWAEYEDGEKTGARQDRVREFRQAWGRQARRVATLGEGNRIPVKL